MPSNAIPPLYDNFDSATLPNRAVFTGGFSTTPGRLRCSSAGTDNAGGLVDTFNNQYSEVTVVTLTTGGKPGVMVRLSTGWNGYMLNADFPASTLFLYKVSTGAYTTLASVAGQTFTVPFKLRLEVIGATLYSYFDGAQILDPTVDTAIATGAPGYYLTGSNVANQELEDWEGGPLPAGSYPARRHPQASAQPLPNRAYRMR